MPDRIQGKTALITGAGSGFGEAIAHAFVREGANVLIGDFVVDSGKRVESEITSKAYPNGGQAIFVQHDVTKRVDWETALQTAKDRFGGLDIVVNNAGTTYRKQPSIGVSEEDFDRILAVNCKSLYWSVQVVMPYFVERGGGVYLNTGSVAGSRTRPGQVFYGGTKGFLNTVSFQLLCFSARDCPCWRVVLLTKAQITQGLAAEYGPAGVRINSIAPLRGATGLLEMFSGTEDTPEERERFGKTVPLGRMSEPEDIANAAVFLASDEAAFISGSNLPVDGGRLAV